MWKRMVLLSLCALLAAPLLAQETGRSLVSAARKRAQEARGKEKEEQVPIYEDSIRILKLVPERFPDDGAAVARAALEMGRLYRRLGRSDEAETAWLEVLKHPEEARPVCDALQDLASHYRRAKRLDDAAQVLLRLIDSYPDVGRPRALALIRLASVHRRQKDLVAAEERLRQCLNEHAALWRQSIDALDDLVAMKIRAKERKEARQLLDTHSAAILARFAETPQEDRVTDALRKMGSRARLDGPEGTGALGDEGGGGEPR